MSMVFSVYPGMAEAPPFQAVIERTTDEVNRYLEEMGIRSRVSLEAVITNRMRDRRSIITPEMLFQWPADEVALISVPWIDGATDVYYMPTDDEERELWQEHLSAERWARYRSHIEAFLRTDHYWRFRRSAGQPGIIALTYGLLAGVVCEMTNGFINATDEAWDDRYLPATGAEFLAGYLRPLPDLRPSSREWMEQVHRSIRRSLEGNEV